MRYTSIGGNYTFIKGNELTGVVRMLSPSQYKGEIFEAFKVTVLIEKLRVEAAAAAA
jgi:hypothetical protein